MGLKLYKRGNRYWLRGTVLGTYVNESTLTENPEFAEAVRIKREGQIAHAAIYGRASVATFDDAVASYLATGAPSRFIREVRKTGGLETGLAVRFAGQMLKDIKQGDLDDAARTLLPNCSRETRIRQIYTPFTAIWNHAVRRQMADMRLWERPRKPRGTNVRTTTRRAGTAPVELDHAARFIATMSPAPAMAMTALFYTGLRPIELFALQAADVNVERRWLVVRSSKTGEPRGVPIHEFLASWLQPLIDRAKSSDGYVFRTPQGAPYASREDGGGGLKSALLGARRRSGIKDISAYTARHTVSTQMVIAGVHPHIKDQILGHAADNMSRHYTHVPQAPLIEAIDKLPVPEGLSGLPWVADPAGWWDRLVEGTGRRTDLTKRVP